MRVAYLVMTGKIIQDVTSKKYTAVDIFSDINLPKEGQEPTPQFLSVMGRLLDMPLGEVTVVVSILRPDGTLLDEQEATGTIGTTDIDINFGFGPLLIDKEGKYTFHVKVNGDPIEDDNQFYFKGSH